LEYDAEINVRPGLTKRTEKRTLVSPKIAFDLDVKSSMAVRADVSTVCLRAM
jgi:hypothetical protein